MYKRQFIICIIIILYLSVACTAMANGIAIISGSPIKAYKEASDGFLSVVKKEVRSFTLTGKNNDQIASEIKTSNFEIIYAVGTQAGNFAKDNFPNIPIVFSMISRPREHGFDNKNIFGVSINIPTEEQFKNLSIILKDKKRLGVISNPENSRSTIKEASLIAEKYGIKLKSYEVDSYKMVPEVLGKMLDEIDIFWLIMDDAILEKLTIQHIIQTSTKNKIPVMSFSPKFLENGAFISVKMDYFDMGAQAGEMAKEFLDSHRIPENRIMSPRKIIPVVNRKLADYFGFKIDNAFDNDNGNNE